MTAPTSLLDLITDGIKEADRAMTEAIDALDTEYHDKREVLSKTRNENVAAFNRLDSARRFAVTAVEKTYNAKVADLTGTDPSDVW